MKSFVVLLKLLLSLVIGIAAIVAGAWLIAPQRVTAVLPTPKENEKSSASASTIRVKNSNSPGRRISVPPRQEFSLGFDPLVISNQRVMSSQITIGKEFFRRIEIAVRQIPKYKGQILDEIDGPSSAELTEETGDPMTDREWNSLSNWWNAHGRSLRLPLPEEVEAAEARFTQLAQQPSRTVAEDDELERLVARCGHEWLRIPYDKRKQQFDLQSPEPPDSVGFAYRQYEEIKRAIVLRHTAAYERRLRLNSSPLRQ